MFLRVTSLFFALLFIVSCSKKEEDPAPVDKLVGNWSVTEEVTFNEFTGMTFVTTKLPNATYNAMVTKVTPTMIKIEAGRSNSPEYELSANANLTVNWDEQSISVPGAVVSGKITDENHFTVTHMWAVSSGYYDVVRTFSR